MENKAYHNGGTVPKYNPKIVERDKINTSTTYTFLVGTRTLIKWRD
jgi:hypothetical protein